MDEIGEKALLLAKAVLGELELGTKHYINGIFTEDPFEILEGIQDGTLTFEPTENRKYLFRKQ